MQGTDYVAYTPALDISTFGKSKKEAQQNFEELVNVFFAATIPSRQVARVVYG